MTTRLAHHVPIIKQSQVIPQQVGQSNFSAASPVAVDFDGDGELDAGAAQKSGELVANRQPGFCFPGHDARGNRFGRLKYFEIPIGIKSISLSARWSRTSFMPQELLLSVQGRIRYFKQPLGTGATAFHCTWVFERKEPNQTV